jgi:hypothetical protein
MPFLFGNRVAASIEPYSFSVQDTRYWMASYSDANGFYVRIIMTIAEMDWPRPGAPGNTPENVFKAVGKAPYVYIYTPQSYARPNIYRYANVQHVDGYVMRLHDERINSVIPNGELIETRWSVWLNDGPTWTVPGFEDIQKTPEAIVEYIKANPMFAPQIVEICKRQLWFSKEALQAMTLLL